MTESMQFYYMAYEDNKLVGIAFNHHTFIVFDPSEKLHPSRIEQIQRAIIRMNHGLAAEREMFS